METLACANASEHPSLSHWDRALRNEGSTFLNLYDLYNQESGLKPQSRVLATHL